MVALKGRGVGCGFSLLEILFAMVLFMVVIASFAMVFPSGYHLNLKNYRENQSVELTKAILQEIASKPLESPPGGMGVGDSIENLQGWACTPQNNPTCPCGAGNWSPQALCDFYKNNPGIANEYKYGLSPSGGNNPGIRVNFLVPILTSDADNPLAQITVNLQWIDNGVTKTVTLSTMKTNNRY